MRKTKEEPKPRKPEYTVIEKYLPCVVTDSEGRHVLATASQKTLKYLYETGHQDKIERAS